MRNSIVRIIAVVSLFRAAGCAQDLGGDWQGTLKTGAADLRTVLRITKEADNRWKATLFSIDQGTEGRNATSVALQGTSFKMIFDSLRATYEGKINEDGSSIAGTWTQGRPLPLGLKRATKETAWQVDPTAHTVLFITVDNNVTLEVLDWGGSGRPVVLLTGQGNNAHVYDKFAPKLTTAYHVFGITRRGYGASSAPAPTIANYAADRLGDDVITVIDSLKLNRPVLVGHSLGGEELSSVGSRHPDKVAGLVYLDAGYSYAYDAGPARGGLPFHVREVQKKLEQLEPGKGPPDPRELIRELLETSLPTLEKDLRQAQKNLEAMRPQQQANQLAPTIPPIEKAIQGGMQKYTDIRVPILAIYAVPHDRGPAFLKDAPAARAAADAADLETTGAQAKAFEDGLPSARVVRLAHASHYVFLSNEADVMREMKTFIDSLQATEP